MWNLLPYTCRPVRPQVRPPRRGPDRGVPGESEDEDDQLNYYGADEDPDSADEAALEVAEAEIMYYKSADEDSDEAAPEVAEPENIFDRLRRRFD